MSLLALYEGKTKPKLKVAMASYSHAVAENMKIMTRHKEATGTFNRSFTAQPKGDDWEVGVNVGVLASNPVFISKMPDGDYSKFIVDNDPHYVRTRDGHRVLSPTSGVDATPLQVAKATGSIGDFL